MRPLFSLLLLMLALCSKAQITGSAYDEKGTPLFGATASLIRAKDSAVSKLAITKADGSFRFEGIKEGNYRVLVSFVGFEPAYSSAIPYDGAIIILPAIQLVKLAGNLGNMTITAKKPLVEVKADRLILNVEGTVSSIGTNVLELLRKSPGVLLDKDDNISLSGKNGVQVYVDGRSSPLTGQDLATYLKTLQSAQVEAIELITNPSSKYDAAGNAGIINIRLVKNKSLGATGSVNAGWNVAILAKYNGGLSLNYRNKSINLFSTYSFSYAPNEQQMHIERNVLDTLFDQTGRVVDQRKSHNYKVGADYFVNKKSTVGIMVNGVLSDPALNTINRSVISYQPTNTIDKILVADNGTTMKRHNTNINLNYSYTDAKGRNLVLNADRGSYDLFSDQLQRNYYYDAPGKVKMMEVIYHMLSPASISIHSLKGDYEENLWKGKLSIGAKGAWVKSDNDFRRSNVYANGEELDKDRSFRFIYKENIDAGYVNYNRQIKTMTLQFGVRVEHTLSEGKSEGQKFNGTGYSPEVTSFKRFYTDIFPSAAITCNKDPKKVWSLNYSRRIDRPAYQDLNPFEFKLDEYTFMKGNINLRPQYTNTIGISHVYKYKLNIAVNYSHIKDMFTQIIDTVEKSKAFVSKKNLAFQDLLALNVNYPFQHKGYSLFTSFSSNYSKYQADFGSNRKVNLAALAFNLFIQNSIKFSKTWTAELSGFYNSPAIYMGNFKGKAIYNVDAGLSKQIMKGKTLVKLAVSDVFHTMKFNGISDFAGQKMLFSYRQESRQLKLSLNYRFGNLGVKPARQRATGAEEELKRVQPGTGVMGNN